MSIVMKNFLSRAANAPSVWPLFRFLRGFERRLGRFCDYVERQRAAGAREDLKSRILREAFPDRTVKNGPFAGLVYPEASATGSALLPKLLGGYEDELHPVLMELREQAYDLIVDVGCAEGYYAIGLGKMFPDARILAYDVDMGARQMCAQMAQANGVSDRLELGGWCTGEVLATLPPGQRALIVSDCEGYEKELFSEEHAPGISRHDILVELHDFKDARIGTAIREAFAKTHSITVIDSKPDFRKAAEGAYPELAAYGAVERRFIVEECRGAPQSWLFLKSLIRLK